MKVQSFFTNWLSGSDRKPRASSPHRSKHGFTIVEFSLASAFIAVLLIVIAAVISNIISTYQKGVTMKDLNSVAESLVDEIQLSINAATSTDIITDEKDYLVVKNENSNTAYGFFCTGNDSYAWQAGTNLSENPNAHTIKYPGGISSVYRLLKISGDIYRTVCVEGDKEDNSRSGQIDVSNFNGESSGITGVTELLDSGDISFEIRDFSVNPIGPMQNQDAKEGNNYSGQVLFVGTFTLATASGADNLASISDAEKCNVDEGFNCCALDQFTFAARTAGAY